MSHSLLWHGASATTLATVGTLCRVFLLATQRKVEVQGMQQFVEFMDRRKGKHCNDGGHGVVTVSNHISVLDDPLMWGTLPFSKILNPDDVRWALGSHDICFTTRIRSLFFSLARVLPTYRKHKSPSLNGLFQPALDESVRLLSHPTNPQSIHVFPEGRVHQHPTYQMRYFKWGVSRLLLEPPTAPVVIPIFLSGFSDVMHESRGFPRFLPRIRKNVRVAFGEPTDPRLWQDLRKDWNNLTTRYGYEPNRIGDSCRMPEGLRTGQEVVRLRTEVTARVREEVVKLRRRLGWPEEEPHAKSVENYRGPDMRKEGITAEDAWDRDA